MVKKARSILSVLLSLVFAAVFCLPVTAQDTVNGISVSAATVTEGESVTLSVCVPAAQYNADTLAFRVSYDPTVLDAGEWETDLTGNASINNVDPVRGILTFSLVKTSGYIDMSRGVVIKMKLTAKAGSAGRKCDFLLYDEYATLWDGTLHELWAPAVRNASVSVAGNTNTPDDPSPSGSTDPAAPKAVYGDGLSVPFTTLARGEYFTVSVKLPEIAAAGDRIDLKTSFDADAFEVISWTPAIPGVSLTSNYDNRLGYFSLYGSNTSTGIDCSQGLVFTAKMRVRDDAPLGYPHSLLLEQRVFSAGGVSLWTSANNSAYISVTEGGSPTVSGGGISVLKNTSGIGDSYSGTTFACGEEFTVYVTVPRIETKATSAYINVSFDSDVFEVVSWSPVIAGLIDRNSGSGYFRLRAYNASQEIDARTGLTFTAVLRVKKNAPVGTYYLRLDKSDLLLDGNTTIPLWKPQTTSAGVTVISSGSSGSGSGSSSGYQPITGGGGLTLSAYSAYRGEHVKAYITIPALTFYAQSPAVDLYFDPSVFSGASWDYIPSCFRAVKGYNSIGISAADNADFNSVLRSGVTLTADLTVSGTAPSGTSSLYIKTNIADSYGSGYRAIWLPSSTSVGLFVNDSSYYYSYPASGGASWAPASPDTDRAPYTDDDTEPDDDTAPVPPADSEKPVSVGEDDEEYDEDEDDEEEDASPSASGTQQITMRNRLTGLTAGNVAIKTYKEFYAGHDIRVELTSSAEAAEAAREALKTLGLSDRKFYAFDIRVYDVTAGKYIHSIRDGYIEFTIPVPETMKNDAGETAVYHIDSGVPEKIASSLTDKNGGRTVRFRSDSFSPYIFVGAADPAGNTSKTSDDIIIVGPGSSGAGNILNPATGAAAAVLIPAALTGCVILSGKSRNRRRRAKKKHDTEEE